MDNQEINLRIAKKKGFNPITGNSYSPEVYGIDYINDPALNRELELELLNRGWKIYKLVDEYYWLSRGNDPIYIITNQDFGKATCLAWLEEFT